MTYLKAKFIPVKNPYIVGDPIKDSKMFFGREQDFLNLRQLIEGGGAHVQLLIAGRRSGKTSLLFEIQRGRLKEIAEAVFVDFHELVPQLRQNEDFPRLIGEAILRNSAFSVCTEEFRQRSRNNWTTQLIVLVDRCLEVIKPRKLLLLCDEFESIEDCFNQQRLNSEALLWTRPILDKSVFFILTGSHNFESKIVSTALSNLSQIINIQALAKKDAERLICIPVFGELDYDEEVVSRILRLSGNQPFYIQFLCNTLVNQNNAVYQHSKLVPEDLEDTLKYIFKNPHNHIEDTWKNPLGHHRRGNVKRLTQAHHFLATLANTLKSPDEYAAAESILATATDRDFTVSKETIRTTVGWLKQNSPLLETPIEEDCYRFQIDLLRRWIAYRFRFGEDVEVYRESQQEEESTIHTSTAGGTDEQQVQAYLEQLQESWREENTITLTERQDLDSSVTDLKLSPQQAEQLENQLRAQLRLPELDWRAEYKESCRVLQRQYSRHQVPSTMLLELKATYEDRQRLSPFEAKEIRQYLRVEKTGPSVARWIGIIVGLVLLLVIVAGVWWYSTTTKPVEPKVTSIQGYDYLVVDLDKANKKKLFLVNSSETKPVPLLEGLEEEQSHPSISLDNQFLVFQRGQQEICLIQRAQGTLACQPGQTPSLAPDGSKVVYVPLDSENALGIWPTDDTQKLQTVTFENETGISLPVFLSDNQHIVFKASTGMPQVFLYDSAKEISRLNPKVLTSSSTTTLVASPTENRVLGKNSKGWFAIVVNLGSTATSEKQELSISTNARPSFSKDGKEFYYIDDKRITYSPLTTPQNAQRVGISLTDPREVVPLR